MSLANLLANLFTLIAVGIPLMRAINELLKAFPKKTPPPEELIKRIDELEGDRTISRRLVECLAENERLKAAGAK